MISLSAMINKQERDLFKQHMLTQNADPEDYNNTEIDNLRQHKQQMDYQIDLYRKKIMDKETYGSKKDYIAAFEWKELKMEPSNRISKIQVQIYDSQLNKVPEKSQKVVVRSNVDQLKMYNVSYEQKAEVVSGKYIQTFGHSYFQMDEKIYKFMGCYLENECISDYLIFNVKEKNWKYVETYGQVPYQREGQLVILVGYRVFMIGGHYNERYYCLLSIDI